ncbi:MAG: hypothetical protein JXA60_01190, partial [Candidatus Coatesbacteria bacterium]|nr:hypothetical protein [Candidatus Coatesbacteria bacterium]
MRIFIMILVGFSVLWGEHFWSDFRSNCRQDGLAKCVGPRDPNFLWEITFKPTGNNESTPENKSIGFYTP